MTIRPGVILIYALILLMAATAVAAAAAAMSSREVTLAGAYARLLGTRAEVESAAAEVVATWSTERYHDMGLGATESIPIGRPDVTATVTRLAPELYIVETEAAPTAGAPEIVARAGRLLRTVDGMALMPLFPAALTADSLIRVSGGFASGDARCAATARPPAYAPTLSITIPLSPEVPPVLGRPGPYSDSLLTLLSSATEVTISSQDQMLPGDDEGHLIMHVPEATSFTGGRATGVLLAGGNVRLSGTTRFEGVILARGMVTIEQGASVTGAVRAAETEVTGGSIRFDSCLVAAALRGPAFDRPYRPAGREWVPVFPVN